MILDKLMNWRRRRAATKRKPTFVSPTATPERRERQKSNSHCKFLRQLILKAQMLS